MMILQDKVGEDAMATITINSDLVNRQVQNFE